MTKIRRITVKGIKNEENMVRVVKVLVKKHFDVKAQDNGEEELPNWFIIGERAYEVEND